MRYFSLVLFTALLFAACSGQKELQMGRVDQDPCRNETQLNDPGEFTGETVENLTVYQQGDMVFATMDVRTLCNSRLTFEPKKENDMIVLRVKNNNSGSADCACISKVTTSFTNPGKGDYKVRVMNERGNLLLAEQQTTIQ